MKTICFVSLGDLLVTKGGIHRVTYCLMNELEKRGYRCIYLFYPIDESCYYTGNVEDEAHKLSPGQVEDYLNREKVDVVVYQQAISSTSFTKLISSFKSHRFKYISVFHNTPAIYEKTLTFSRLWYSFLHQSGMLDKVSNCVRMLVYPLWRRRVIKGSGKLFAVNYDASDKCVMLSSNDWPTLAHYLKHDVSEKCVTIHNPLTFDTIETAKCLCHKKKNVLIVSRLNNFEKRLDRALKIWKKIEAAGFNDWHLYIVGWGLQEKMLHNLARKLGLQNVHFEGRQPSEPYYRDASIFMMTSAVEGWGLTLTESMQTGVVPIAFDSYPALHDIITDRYDGYIIPDDDLDTYAACMEELMRNREERERIAKNGLESCRRFEINKIVEQWVKLIESL